MCSKAIFLKYKYDHIFVLFNTLWWFPISWKMNSKVLNVHKDNSQTVTRLPFQSRLLSRLPQPAVQLYSNLLGFPKLRICFPVSVLPSKSCPWFPRTSKHLITLLTQLRYSPFVKCREEPFLFSHDCLDITVLQSRSHCNITTYSLVFSPIQNGSCNLVI